MKRILVKIGAVALVVGGLIAVLWPVPTWRMYDAQWRPLAMTQAESWCAGLVFGETLNNVEDPVKAEACIVDSDLDNTTPDISTSVKVGCQGFEAVTLYPTDQCMQAFEDYQLWWLANGGYTFEWNASNPRPQVIKTDIVNAPRREGRTDETRDDLGRLGG